MKEELKNKLEKQDLGTHMCCIYRNKEEQLSILAYFISLGLDKWEKCIYIVDDRTKQEVISALKKIDIDIDKYVNKGQLEFLTKKESYLKGDYFDPDEMIELLKKAEEQALSEGYMGLRVTGEMTWCFSDLPGTEKLLEYEMKLNDFLPNSKTIAICQYNEKRFSPEILLEVIHTHPKVILYDSIHENQYYQPPKIFLARSRGEVPPQYYETIKNNIIERTKLENKQKEEREKLRESQEKLSQIIYSNSIPTFVIDRNHFLTHWNKACEILTGVKEDEIIGTKKQWIAFYHNERPVLADMILDESSEDEIREYYGENVKKSSLLEDAYEAEDFFPQFGKKGRWVYFTASPLKNSEGEFIGAIETLQDITDRKEREIENRELNRFRERIIQDANIWLNVIDKDGNVLVWNKAAEKISGYSEEEVIGNNRIWEWLYPSKEYRKEIFKQVSDILEGRKVEEYETVIKCKEDKDKVISWTSHPLENDKGEVIGSIAIGRDVTEQRAAEEREEFLTALLRQDIGSKSQLTMGYLQLLEDSDLTKENKKNLEKALKTEREVQEILELAKELKKIEDTDWNTEEDISKILDHVVSDISGLIEKEGISISINSSDKVGKVRGNYSLKNMFSYLLKTRILDSACEKIKINFIDKSDKVIVKIEDDGENLPLHLKDLLLGELYTGDTSGAGGARYYMIQQIAEHNNVKIDIKESQTGKTRYDVILKKVQ
ncbi:MAG: MEDS domain-containing protein [Thermoplasmatota archaeon]